MKLKNEITPKGLALSFKRGNLLKIDIGDSLRGYIAEDFVINCYLGTRKECGNIILLTLSAPS